MALNQTPGQEPGSSTQAGKERGKGTSETGSGPCDPPGEGGTATLGVWIPQSRRRSPVLAAGAGSAFVFKRGARSDKTLGSPACPGQRRCQAAVPLPAVPVPVCCVIAQLFIDSRLYPGNRRMLTSIIL